MRIIRPIEVVTCCICGEPIDKIKAKEIFTGRTKYMCPACHAAGERQLAARKTEWRESSRGKQIIAESERNK